MDAKVAPPDFSEMCHEIEAAGQRAMHPVGDDEKSTVLFEYALNEVMGIRATVIAAGISFKRNKEAGHKARQVRELAEWELGHLLRAMDEANLRDKGYATKGRKAGAPTDLPTLEQLGIARHDSRKWQRKARIPKEEFLASIATAKPKSQRRSRRIMDYPLHPITADYDDFTAAELEALRESLRERGLVVPIVIWQEQIVDGRHRDKLCKEEGIPRRYNDITKLCKTEAEMRAHVAALNQHRRARTTPLTTIEKRIRIEAALKANPERSNRQIGEELGVSKTTVSDTRTELEATGQIGQLDKHVGKDGKARNQPSRKRKPAEPNDKPLSPEQARAPCSEPTLFDHAPSLAEAGPESEAAPVSQARLQPQSEQKTGDAPPVAPDEPAPTPDPWAGQRAAVRGSIRGLAKLKDVDLGPVANAMPRQQLIEARAELDEATRTITNWRDALDAAIERASAHHQMPPAA